MSNSTNIVLRDLTTGAGRTGLTVTLKNHLDNFTAIVATGVEISGKPGVYEFVDLPLAKYKLYAGDTEDKSLGGNNGKWLPIMDSIPSLPGNNSYSGVNAYTTEKVLTDAKEFTYKSWVQAAITTVSNTLTLAITAVSNALSAIYGDNHTWTGFNWFNNKIKVNSGSTSGTKSEFYGWTAFVDAPPIYMGTAPYTGYQQLVNKGYVDGLLASIGEGNYTESPNVIRLMPDAAEVAGKNYNSWFNALTYTGGIATANHRMSILISGMGNLATYITPVLVSGKYIKDYTYFKALGAGVNLAIAGATGTEWTATDFTACIIEGVNYSINDSDNPTNFSGITFINCNFNIADSTGVTFLNCRFLGSNTFSGGTAGLFTFNNCIGERVLCTYVPTISGTNKLPYYTLTELSIGNLILKNNSGNLETSAGIVANGGIIASAQIQANNELLVKNDLLLDDFGGDAPAPESFTAGSITDAFGIHSGAVLREPVRWLNITVQGTIYSVPLYAL